MHAHRIACRHRAIGTGGPRRSTGFSLIEMLAVIVVIVVVSSVALLSVDLAGSAARLNDEGQRLRGLLALLCEEAVLQNRELGLQALATGYAFAQWNGETWEARSDRPFLGHELPEDFQLQLTVEGNEVALTEDDAGPQVICYSSGELTPFELLLQAPDGARMRLAGDLLGGLELEHHES